MDNSIESIPLHDSKNQPIQEETIKDDISTYIYKNIEQRECKTYIRDTASPSNNCQCGHSVKWHEEKGLDARSDLELNQVWQPDIHTQLKPCDSFGEIEFRGFGSQTRNSPYMRLDFNTDLDNVWTVLTEYWHLPLPKLIISVTGGAKLFTLKPRLKTLLKQGLVNTALSTGAWIITGGTAAGVCAFVGEAVQDYIMSTPIPRQNQCVALGIAAWGVIANNPALEGKGRGEKSPAQYTMEDLHSCSEKFTPLDHNHTHFLLVDDGTEGKYGGEIEFRSKLESYISTKVKTGTGKNQSVFVPSVVIAVEGGVNTLRTVFKSIEREIPVVIVEGSGRAADYIAHAYRITKCLNDEDEVVFADNFDDVMRKKAHKLFSTKDLELEEKIANFIPRLRDCLKKRRLLNIFKLDKADSIKDIDRAILYALLRANKFNAKQQLALALAWNRCDIARQEIFSLVNRVPWRQEDLFEPMFMALVHNRTDFVELFIDNGVDLKKFLTVERLWRLYSTCLKNSTDAEARLIYYLINLVKQSLGSFIFRGCKKGGDIHANLLPYIGEVTVHLLQDQNYNFYSDLDSNSRKSSKTFDYPERDLLLWATLFNHREMVHFFWKQGRDHLGGALFASALLQAMSQVAKKKEEDEASADMEQHASVCEKAAVGVLNECHARDKQMTHQLLVRHLPQFGGTTVFRLAKSYDMMDFTEHSACQTKLSSIWKGRMASDTPEMKIFLCILCPLLTIFIRYTTKITISKDCKGKIDKRKEDEDEIEITDEEEDEDEDNNNIKKQHRPTIITFKKSEKVGLLAAIFYLYSAPITIFICNIMAFLLFMCTFSYFVLVMLAPLEKGQSVPVLEIVMYAWLATMIVEEVRQVLIREHRGFRYTILTWWSDIWNRFDLFMYANFLFAIFMRFTVTPDHFHYARMTYSITLSMFFLRLMQYLYAEKNVGPKVIMIILYIRKMLTDLMFFFLTLLVFMLSFGTAYQANMYPESQPSWDILFRVLYIPYFQMHGALFLEEMMGEEIGDCTKNETVWRGTNTTRCPEKSPVVISMLAVYMILTNILLVNLLIAMFNYTLISVYDNSIKLWRFFRLLLVYEYFDRPTMVPPFIIINHIFRLVMWAIRRSCGWKQRFNAFKLKLNEDENQFLMQFERRSMETVLSNTKQPSQGTSDSLLIATAERLEREIEELEMIRENKMQMHEIPHLEASDMSADEKHLVKDGILEGLQPLQGLGLTGGKSGSQEGELELLRRTAEMLAAQTASLATRLSHLAQKTSDSA